MIRSYRCSETMGEREERERRAEMREKRKSWLQPRLRGRNRELEREVGKERDIRKEERERES